MTKLFTTLFGSSLYGTQTPTSDRDLKHIVLPRLGHLLLGHKVSNVVHNTNKQKNVRNGVNDVDEEFIPLQVFANDFFMGQTYALELAFAIDGFHAEQQVFDGRGPTQMMGTQGEAVWSTKVVYDEERWLWSYESPLFYKFVHELRSKFLTSNIKAMMGYVVNQANLYSFKGERLNVVRELEAILNLLPIKEIGLEMALCIEETIRNTPDGIPEKLEKLATKYPKYFKKTLYDIGGDRMKPCFTILEKTLPFTNTVKQSLVVLAALMNKYGSRADAASVDNVDWKATMHAVRIVDEGIALLSTGKLEFPFNHAAVNRYLSIRWGEVDINEINLELSSKLDTLKHLETTTFLPSVTPELKTEFNTWLEGWMFKFYGLTND